MKAEINPYVELVQVLLYLADRQNTYICLDYFVEFLSEYENSNLAFEEFYLKNSHRVGELR